MPAFLSAVEINGLFPDWSRVTIALSGVPFLPAIIPSKGIRSLRYAQRANGELSFGNSQTPNGHTSGQIAPSGSITLLLPQYSQFIAALGAIGAVENAIGGLSGVQAGYGGLLNTLFDIVVSYSGTDSLGVPYSIVDLLFSVRVLGTDNNHRSSGSALEVSMDLVPLYIIENGVIPDSVPNFNQMKAAYVALTSQ